MTCLFSNLLTSEEILILGHPLDISSQINVEFNGNQNVTVGIKKMKRKRNVVEHLHHWWKISRRKISFMRNHNCLWYDTFFSFFPIKSNFPLNRWNTVLKSNRRPLLTSKKRLQHHPHPTLRWNWVWGTCLKMLVNRPPRSKLAPTIGTVPWWMIRTESSCWTTTTASSSHTSGRATTAHKWVG